MLLPTFRDGVVAAAEEQVAVDQRLAAARPVGGFVAGVDVATAAEGLAGGVVARAETGSRAPHAARCTVCGGAISGEKMDGVAGEWMEV